MIIQQQSSSFNNFFENPDATQQRQRFQQKIQFPEDGMKLQIFVSIDDFMNKLKNIEDQKPVTLKNLWKLKKRNPYFYLKCRYCTARIHVKQLQHAIIFLEFQNKHQHQTKSYKQLEEQQVRQYILNNKLNQELKFKVMNQFNITLNRYHYIISKLHKQHTFQELLQYLDQKNFLSQYEFNSEIDFPQLFITSSVQMREMRNYWGEVVCLDVTYNLIKQRPKTSGSQWGAAIFSGLDSNFRIVIFAVALMSNQNHFSMKRILQGYLSTKLKQPHVFITDQQLSIKSALSELKQQGYFHGQHLYDSYHILKNLRKKVQKNAIKYFNRLIKTTSTEKFERTLKNLLQYQDQEKTTQKFIQNSHHYCFTQIPEVFFGFSSSNSRSQKINDMLKQLIPRQTSFLTFFQKIDKLTKQYHNNTYKIQRQNKKYEDLFNDIGLKHVRQKVQRKVFQKFLQTYVRALKLNIEQVRQNIFLCTTSFKIQQYYINSNQNTCKCGYIQKTGIPCQHLLRVLWSNRNFSYQNFINKRWIRTSSSSQFNRKKGRPKNSRKNMIK